ncbi:hypothetical protein [Sporosarcina sp. Te-1]|uniref:hypothetical protein n=1 Tax=Sporosarcina sp. Te-1 TaxID=2818390 RepID=UPI001A9E464A|nr:hypothetical protein [Sporosarcina sp. Te-1]QTD42769.1 hypothetical protein J3U78_08375 [Sporosarcina sp. Te-1]
MRKVIAIAIILFFSFSIYSSIEQVKNMEFEKLATFERDVAKPFFIPEDEVLEDSEIIFPLLKKAAIESNVNLFRSARYWTRISINIFM